MLMDGISVCIPIYNRDCTRLIADMQRLGEKLDTAFEVLIADDCSTAFADVNSSFAKTCPDVRYLQLSQNVGRSRIRNFLVQNARFSNLVFLDCDVQVVDDDFLQKYVDVANFPVVVGGATFGEQRPDNSHLLRWLYSRKVEYKPACQRNVCPNRSFMTLNFMAHRDVMIAHPFQESFSKYGHEDTVMGWQLQTDGIIIHHIDNVILHLGLDDFESFMEKSRQAVQNMRDLYLDPSSPQDLIQSINILRFYNKIKSLHLVGLVRCLSKMTNKLVLKNLAGSNPSIMLFQWYKLGYLLSLI